MEPAAGGCPSCYKIQGLEDETNLITGQILATVQLYDNDCRWHGPIFTNNCLDSHENGDNFQDFEPINIKEILMGDKSPKKWPKKSMIKLRLASDIYSTTVRPVLKNKDLNDKW